VAHPNVDDFEEVLLKRPLDAVVREYIFEPEPYAFRDWPRGCEILRAHLCRSLRLSEQNVIVIGSAKVGFSLSPDNFGRRFSDDSDIDVLVVDDALFDTVWKTLLQWNYPRRYHLSGADWKWARSRMGDLYWGWFTPDKIRYDGLSFPDVLKPLRDISVRWFNAFRSLSRYPQFAGREFSGRLYRTWDHALLYHIDGLRQISDAIRARREG